MVQETRSTGSYTAELEENERPFISGDGRIQNVVAEKLHQAAQKISQKTSAGGTNPEIAHYGKEASEMLEQSAAFVRDLDLSKVEASVRQYVKENPGRSLLIAGVTGLVLGALFRRR
jgi:ElaB/YqjD/DUF883 family membrane-anchored ribosome-binding protein